jgi:hypothetical protein
MFPIKVSQERYQEILNLPGCTFVMESDEGGYCALGKLRLVLGEALPGNFTYLLSTVIGLHMSTFIANNNNFAESIPYGEQYLWGGGPKLIMPGDAQWEKHEQMTKLAFAKVEKAGLIQIEKVASLESEFSKEVKSRGLISALTAAIEATYAFVA